MATESVRAQVKDYNSISELRAVLKKLIDSEEKYTKDGLLLLIKVHRRMTLLAFNQMTDPDTDQPWVSWKTGKQQQQKWRAHSTGKSKKILQRSGKLKSSALSASTKSKAQFKKDAEGRWTATLTLKTPEYAATHQFGASVISGKPRVYTNRQTRDKLTLFARKVTIPARPFWPFTRSYMNPKAKGEIDDALKAVFTAYRNSIYKKALEYVHVEEDGFTSSVGFSMPTTPTAKIHQTRLPIQSHHASTHRQTAIGRRAPYSSHTRTAKGEEGTVTPGKVRVFTGAFKMPHGSGENFTYTPRGEAGRPRTKRTGIRGYSRDLTAEAALHERMGNNFPKTRQPRNPNSRYRMRQERRAKLEELRSQSSHLFGDLGRASLRRTAVAFAGIEISHYAEMRQSLVSRLATAERYAADTNTPGAHEAARSARARLEAHDATFEKMGGVPGAHFTTYIPTVEDAFAEMEGRRAAGLSPDTLGPVKPGTGDRIAEARSALATRQRELTTLRRYIDDYTRQQGGRAGPAAERIRQTLERLNNEELPRALKNVRSAERELERAIHDPQRRVALLARQARAAAGFSALRASVKQFVEKAQKQGSTIEGVGRYARNIEKELGRLRHVDQGLAEFVKSARQAALADIALQNQAGYHRGETGGRPKGRKKLRPIEHAAIYPHPGETNEEYAERQKRARKQARYQEERRRTAHQEAVRQLPLQLRREAQAALRERIKTAIATYVTGHPFVLPEKGDLHQFAEKFKEQIASLPAATEEAIIKHLYRRSGIAEIDTRAEGLLEGATRAFAAGEIGEAALALHRKHFEKFMERRIEGPERKARVSAEVQAAVEEIKRRRERKPGETDADYNARMDELQNEIDGLKKIHKRIRIQARINRKPLTPAQKAQRQVQRKQYEEELKASNPRKWEQLQNKKRAAAKKRKARANERKKAEAAANGGVTPPRRRPGPPKKERAVPTRASAGDFRTRRPRREKPDTGAGTEATGKRAGAAYTPKTRTEKEWSPQKDVYGKTVRQAKPPLTQKAKEHNERVRQMQKEKQDASSQIYQNQVMIKVISDQLAEKQRSEEETAPIRAIVDKMRAQNAELAKIRDRHIPALSYRRVTRKTGNYSIRITTSTRPAPRPRITLTAGYRPRSEEPLDTTEYTPTDHPYRIQGPTGRKSKRLLATYPRTSYNVRTHRRSSPEQP